MSAAEKKDETFEEFSKRLQKKISGRSDGLRNTILSFVARDKFDTAVKELRYYQQYKSDLTPFIDRTERLVDHCEELILAIKAKKAFPNIDQMPMGKRQELFERVQDHFDELQNVLKRVEQIENDIRVQDSRSTVWVLQALIVCSMIVVIVAIVNEALQTMGLSFNVVLDDMLLLIYKALGI